MTNEATFSIDLGDGASRRVVRWSGDIDIATAPRVLETCTDLIHATEVELDLTAVTFMDSSGLHCLLTVVDELRASGASVRISAVSPSVARVAKLAGVTEHLELPTQQDCAAS